jgi:serine/threonine protein kinase
MHASGLAHSDLSFNNVLLNPAKGTILIIDIDELVVPGKYSPGVIGTKGFIAPEVLMTSNLALGDPNKYLPRRETDLHALACLIYLYLLRRHPLEGMKTYHDDPEMDDYLAMGEKALFIEHSTDSSNRPAYAATQSGDLSDVNKYPFSITGPFLAKLFRQAFEAGLHNPSLRPIANEWETALIQTYERLVPCSNPLCQEKYFVYSKNKSCPFCGTKLRQEILVIDVYKYDNRSDGYLFSKSQIVGYNGKKLYRWHFYANKFLNESLSADEAQHLAYLQFHNGSWVIVNVGLDDVIVNNSDGIDHFLVKNAYCQIADGSTITVTEKPNGHQLKFKFG